MCDRSDTDTLSKKKKCYFCWVSQRLNLRLGLAVCAALQIDYPSNQQEEEAQAEEHGGLLVDGRQRVWTDHNLSRSAFRPLE